MSDHSFIHAPQNPSVRKERLFILFFLTLTIGIFFSFGWFHLGKFETTDEHLWKYDRIGQYWSALADGDLEKTYINDKPGVTVALVAGVGLLAEPHPEANELIGINNGIFESYDSNQTEITNVRFRLPVLVFSTLSLLAFFFLLQQAFGSWRQALTGTILIALSPVLVGMSQIINPDSFFWIFGGLSIFSYLALLRTKQPAFLFLTGILTGFALLSKYTAFILFAFYDLALFFSILTGTNRTETWQRLGKELICLLFIFLIALGVFALFLPAVFVHPDYLFKGISQFFSGNFFSFPVLVGLVASAGLLFFGIRRFPLAPIVNIFQKKEHFVSSTLASLFLILFAVSLINVWSGQKLVPIDALRDAAYANEPQSFNFRPLIPKGAPEFAKNAKLLLVESYPLFFSLSLFVLGLVSIGCIQLLRNRLAPETRMFLSTLVAFTFLYLASTLFAKVVTNARYIILLYPLFAVGAALVIGDLFQRLIMERRFFFGGLIVFCLLLGSLVLWHVRPFYFSYANMLLPNQFSVHDSWGHGAYEAAQYLNGLPNAKELVIWSNSDTVCRFFEGKCLRSRKIDLARVTPDYFVLSKRGVIKLGNRFTFLNNPHPDRQSDYYFDRIDSAAVWQLEINDRPGNYIRIIPFER